VQGWAFNVDDRVLRLGESNKDCHKLSPFWEGPFIIAEVLQPSTYKLQTPKGEVFANAWNIEHLHRFYPSYSPRFVNFHDVGLICAMENFSFSLYHFLVTLEPSHGRRSGLTRELPGPYPLKIPYTQPVPMIEAKKKMQVAKERALSKAGRTAGNPCPSGYGASAH
jgi:hypothetical protein